MGVILAEVASLHVTFGGSGGMMTTVGVALPLRPSFGGKLLRGESNVTFVNIILYANEAFWRMVVYIIYSGFLENGGIYISEQTPLDSGFSN